MLLRRGRGPGQRGQALGRPPGPGPAPSLGQPARLPRTLPRPALPRPAADHRDRRRNRRRGPGPGQRAGRDRAAAGYIRRHPRREHPAWRADHDRHGGTVRAFLPVRLFLLRGGLVRASGLAAMLLGGPPGGEPMARLTAREREVLELMAEGRSNSAIAQRLFISEKAVGKHSTSIFAKLDLAPSTDDNRRVLAVLAFLNA